MENIKMKFIYIWILAAIILKSSAHYTGGAKCCPDGYLVVPRNGTCRDPQTNTTTLVGISCKKMFAFRAKYTIDEAGTLVLNISGNTGSSTKIQPYQYCLGNYTTTSDVNLTNVREVPVLCADEEQNIVAEGVLGYCSIVSVLFLILTTIVYSALPELRRDLQGRSLINFCGSLAIGSAILSMLKLMAYSDMSLCAARGFLCYFFLMVSFFWTNAIAVQVLRSTRRPTIGNDGWKEFVFYALYAWGSGALITICMAIVNFHPGDHSKPGIGLNHCWFYDRHQQWYYMYSIMAILLGVNVCIFIYTSTLIWRHTFSSNSIKALKYKFVMSLRLIILLGLPWIFEMISSLTSVHIVWDILDVFNTLQGVFIFVLLVVFRKKTIRAMHAHGWLACMAGPVERYLARGADDEELAVQHTEVPMNDHNGIH